MVEAIKITPFGSEPLAEIALPRAPLVRVLSQVRWPQLTVMKAQLDSSAQQVGSKLASQYPLSAEQREVHIVLSPEGVSQQAAGKIFQFRSVDEAWQVSLSESFVALESSHYTSRDDFCTRLEAVLAALASVVDIPLAARIGFRYTNRIAGDQNLAASPNLVQETLLGGHAVPLEGGVSLIHTLSEAVYQVGDIRLLARWAHLPPNSSIDPAIAPTDLPSWVLDLDAFRENRLDFNPRSLAEHARELSAVASRFFRSAPSDDFLRHFGGAL